jgi:hypothetical protein
MPRATTAVEAEDQEVMFPDLDMGNPEHKAIVAAAKKFHKAKAERAETLSTAKEKQDAAMERLIALMHGAKITKFQHDGVKAEIIDAKEKAVVKLSGEEDDDADDE